jgi:hypothetical protein
MRLFRVLFLTALFVALAALGLQAAGIDAVISEQFNDLAGWKPLNFPKIKQHTKYQIEKDGGRSFLAAISNASASGLVYKKEFNVYQYPKVRWRWKIEHVYKKGDATRKDGDDYPIRVYVMFTYDPDKASFGQRVKYGVVKAIYGEYPPDSGLNYIWANRPHAKRIITSPYTDRSKMVVLESGPAKAGQWVDEEIDILADYRAAFGKDPPKKARLAVMNDSDNTGESSISYMDYIEVYREDGSSAVRRKLKHPFTGVP